MLTQIGSLPYSTVEEAIKYILRYRSFGGIPFFPELTLLGDAMLNRIENPEKLTCLRLFKQESFSTVKVQCVGPVSLKQMKKYNSCGEDEIVEIILNYIKVVKKDLNAEQILLFLDEPGMKTAPIGFEYLWEAIFSEFNDIKKGVHICGDSAPWSDILRIEWLDIINPDSSLVDITIFPEYKVFRENGGVVAWGNKKEGDIRDWQIGDIVTPVCGLSEVGGYTELDCERVFNQLNFLSQKLNYLHR